MPDFRLPGNKKPDDRHYSARHAGWSGRISDIWQKKLIRLNPTFYVFRWIVGITRADTPSLSPYPPLSTILYSSIWLEISCFRVFCLLRNLEMLLRSINWSKRTSKASRELLYEPKVLFALLRIVQARQIFSYFSYSFVLVISTQNQAFIHSSCMMRCRFIAWYGYSRHPHTAAPPVAPSSRQSSKEYMEACKRLDMHNNRNIWLIIIIYYYIYIFIRKSGYRGGNRGHSPPLSSSGGGT